MKLNGIILIVITSLIIILFASAYVVDETEQVVVTQFGKVIGDPKKEPGLYFRVPFIQHTTFFPKNLQEWDGDPGQIPTLEKTYIWVDAFARWRITDPIKFFQTVNNTISALGRLDDILDPAVRNFVTSYPLIETVRRTNRVMDTFEIGIGNKSDDDEQEDQRPQFIINTGREKIMEGILKQAQPKLEPFGIELVDIKIKRVNYVEQVQKSVYGRMIAERKQIAEKFRSEGKGEAQKIMGQKERELKRISSGAYRRAQEIKGKAEAEATKLYAEAFGVDPDFYSFSRTLDIYGDVLGQDASLIISTDSELFRYLKGSMPPP
ncbi:MAG: protease modulator HflC [Desulfobacteraceae bacterium]|jgi:membrane protease subunit HflC